MTSECADLPVVVVPEGLAFDRSAKQVLLKPSFVGEAVLNHVFQRYGRRRILIAPGNTFGAAAPEHEVMARWLTIRGCTNVKTTSAHGTGYVDTWRNAVELKRWLMQRGEWPLGPIVLVVAFRHAKRARVCFSRNEFAINSIDLVQYHTTDNPLPPRLFYYNRPRLHQAYEILALIRDRLRSRG